MLAGNESRERQIVMSAYLPNSCLFSVRRAHLELYNLSFVEGIIHEDLAFTFQCTALARGVKHGRRPLQSRRLRTGSISDQIDAALSIEGQIRAIDEIRGLAADHWGGNHYSSLSPLTPIISEFEPCKQEEDRSSERLCLQLARPTSRKRYGTVIGTISLLDYRSQISDQKRRVTGQSWIA